MADEKKIAFPEDFTPELLRQEQRRLEAQIDTDVPGVLEKAIQDVVKAFKDKRYGVHLVKGQFQTEIWLDTSAERVPPVVTDRLEKALEERGFHDVCVLSDYENPQRVTVWFLF